MRSPGTRTASPGTFRRGLLALAGLLVLGGCSAGGKAPIADGGGTNDGVRLSPNPANSASRISVVFADDQLRQAKCQYVWRKNGNLIPDATTDGLDPSNFSKNDEISVTVSTSGPAAGAERTLKGSVHVQNTPPMLTGTSLMVSTASGTPELQTQVQCADPDGDVPTYSYRWFKNGKPIENATAASLPLSLVGRGDQVVVEVVARDDESASPPRRSEAFTIENRPPTFTSQPMTPSSRDMVFRYQAVATDPDGDPLRYELVSGPAGMTVDTNGLVNWELPKDDQRRGTFPVRVRATDSKGGEATQDFTISLDPPPGRSS